MHSAKDEAVDSVQTYGITQDPETSNYMIVMVYMELGSLRSNLMIKKYNPYDKYNNLYLVARSLSALCRTADKPTKSDEICGIIPYMAPEVLRGMQYTKSADIYSFGIVMWEMTSGVPAFNNTAHDHNLSLKICRGLRPDIIEGTEPEYSELMKKCWNPNPDERPTAEELVEHFIDMRKIYLSNYERTPVPGK